MCWKADKSPAAVEDLEIVSDPRAFKWTTLITDRISAGLFTDCDPESVKLNPAPPCPGGDEWKL